MNVVPVCHWAGTEPRTYATWDPAAKSANIALSGGNLIATLNSNGQNGIVKSTISKSSGKWYWEIHYGALTTGNRAQSGIVTAGTSVSGQFIGNPATGWCQYSNNSFVAVKGNNSGSSAYGQAMSTGNEVIGIALDMDNGTIRALFNGIDTFGTMFSGLTPNTMHAAVSGVGVNNFIATTNFGASQFTYSPPIGYHPGLYTTP